MRPAGARASNPPTVQTGLWADLGPRSATPPPKTTPRKKPETLAEENARLRARVAELEAVASMAGPARRCEAALGSGAKEEKGKGRSRGQAAGKSEAKSVNEVRAVRDPLGSAGERRSSLDEAWRGQGVYLSSALF